MIAPVNQADEMPGRGQSNDFRNNTVWLPWYKGAFLQSFPLKLRPARFSENIFAKRIAKAKGKRYNKVALRPDLIE